MVELKPSIRVFAYERFRALYPRFLEHKRPANRLVHSGQEQPRAVFHDGRKYVRYYYIISVLTAD